MAALSGSIQVTFSSSGMTTFSLASGALSISMAGTDFCHVTQNIDTTAENLQQNDVGTPGFLLVKNLDASNYVEIGHDETGSFVADVKLKAGEWAFFRCAQATPQARANTGACNIEFVLFED